MPSGKRRAAAMHEIAATAAAQPEEIRSRRTAAEQTYQGVLNRLGAKGTYENVGGSAPSSKGILGTPSGSGAAAGDPFTEVNAADLGSSHVRNVDTRYTNARDLQKFKQLDPTKALEQVEQSSQFRTMSRLQAEGEQLLAREGELYDEMLKNTQLPIMEGSAALARENAETLKRAFARGGSARRQAFETVQKIRQKHEINSQKVRAISERRFELDQWARQNARTNLEFGQNWAANLGGVRESYNAAMDQASELMLTRALPIMALTRDAAHDARDAAHAKNRQKLTRWVQGITSVVGAFMGNPAALGGLGGAIGQTAASLPSIGRSILGATGAVGATTTLGGGGNTYLGQRVDR